MIWPECYLHIRGKKPENKLRENLDYSCYTLLIFFLRTFKVITTPAWIICDLVKWVSPLDFLPRRLGLFLWAAAENVSNDFGFIRFEKGEIFWKKTKGTAEGTSKDLDNSVIKLPCANRLVILYPFVYIVLRWMNSRSINCNHLNGFSFYSRCIFSLNMFLGLKSVAKDLKMDLGRVVVITAKSKSENSLSFRAPIGAARRRSVGLDSWS